MYSRVLRVGKFSRDWVPTTPPTKKDRNFQLIIRQNWEKSPVEPKHLNYRSNINWLTLT